MCVAVVVLTPEGPSEKELRQMWAQNPHGAGLAFQDGNTVFYAKGLSDDDMVKLVAEAPRPTLLHYRWATHGSKQKYLTHPFPLGDAALTSKDLHGNVPAVLIHNGVWSDYSLWLPKGFKGDVSDTAVAAYVAEEHEAILDEVHWSTALARVIDGTMQVRLRGRWQYHDGDLYSNLYWRSSGRSYMSMAGSEGFPYNPAHEGA
jgi:predicted glutamine amidotransferase